jgi:nucleoside-diphosphate-sugar epimerase
MVQRQIAEEAGKMRILILGAAGMIGRSLARKIASDGQIAGRSVTALELVDVINPPVPSGLVGRVGVTAADLARPGTAERLLSSRPDLILHLAAVVSGEAEVDFAKGYNANLDATRALLEVVRSAPDWCPRLVFASSLAVLGPPFPAVIPDDFAPQPATSYGTQKLIVEHLIDDHTRKGFVDGLSLRLPTICVRPGVPNRAASGFFSGILREPLAGLPAALPVPEDTRHYFASPRAAVGFFLHAAGLETAGMDHRRALVMPGLSASVSDQIDALRRFAGKDAVALIRRSIDPLVAQIVAGWGSSYAADRARSLGFQAETTMDEIVAAHVEDELGGTIGSRTGG